MNAWEKFRAASPEDRRLLWEASSLLVAVRLGLMVLSYRTLRRLTRPSTPPPTPPGIATPNTPARIGWAISAMARRLPGKMTCLVQALVAERMLHRHGFHATLQIGVARAQMNKEITAHAWVECDGRIVVGETGDLEHYSVLGTPVGSGH